MSNDAEKRLSRQEMIDYLGENFYSVESDKLYFDGNRYIHDLPAYAFITLINMQKELRGPLEALSDGKLKICYDRVSQLIAEKTRERIETLESRRPWNLQEHRPDTEYWSCMPSWTRQEAVALSLGFSPEIATREKMQPFASESPSAREYLRRLDVADRARNIQHIAEPVVPAAFAEWAKGTGWRLPEDLVADLARCGHEVRDWKSEYERIENENNLLIKKIANMEIALVGKIKRKPDQGNAHALLDVGLHGGGQIRVKA